MNETKSLESKSIIESLKFKNDDLQHRLEISEKIRLDLQKNIQETQKQDQFFYSRQIKNLNEQLEKIKNERNQLETDLKEKNTEIDTLKNHILFYENSKKIQEAKILEISSQCFKQNFKDIDDVLKHMVIQPKVYEENTSQNSKVQARLLKKIKNEKTKKKCSEADLKHLQIVSEQKYAAYEEKIALLNQNIREMQTQINNITNEYEKTVLSLQTKLNNTKKSRLFFYKEPAISIPGTPLPTDVIDDLAEKVKLNRIYLKDSKNKNKKLQQIIKELKSEINEKNERIGEFEEELATSKLLREEGEKQLQTLRAVFDSNKDDNIKYKKIIIKQKRYIDAQLENIQKLHKTITDLEGKISELKIQFIRVQKDDSESEHHEFDIQMEPSNPCPCMILNKFENSFNYSDCYTPEVPSFIEPQIQSIIMNSSLQPVSKIKMIMKILCSYFTEQIHALAKERSDLQIQLNKYVNSFTDFIPKLTATVLNKHIPVMSFIDDFGVQNKILMSIQRKCNTINNNDCLKLEASNLTEETKKLQSKVKQYKKELCELRNSKDSLESNNQEKSRTILELQSTVKILQRKCKDLQNENDRQKREFLQKLENTKNETEGEYEKIIEHMKKKYTDQRNAINNLSAQLALHQIS